MPRTVTQSSDGRLWTGFGARLIDTFGGTLEFVPSVNHHVSMHVGRPVRASCRCDGRVQRRLQVRGDIDIVPMGYPIRWEDDGPTSILCLDLSPALVRSAAESMGVDPDRAAIAPQLQLQDPLLQHICWAVVAELEDGDPACRLYGESLGMALASHLIRRYVTTVSPKIKPVLSRRQFQRVVEYVDENLQHNLSLASVAAIAGVSVSHFKALFKESCGLPVHRYIVRRRVEGAVRLLLRGLPGSEVAAQMGFSDQSHMARCMRRVLGLTPSDVREHLSS
jgi:AraC family transcriptional regulator